MRRARAIAIGTAVVAIGAGAAVALAVTGPFDDTSATEPSADDASSSEADSRTELDTVGIERGDLTATSEFTGEFGFGDAWPLSLTADGIVTNSFPVGTVVDFGEPLIEIDSLRVFLAEGNVPMYRDLELASPRLQGKDVAQLERFLIAQGYDRDGTLEVDGVYDSDTRQAVKDWQDGTWQPDTGKVTRSDMVFSPQPLRISGEQRVGGAFEELEVTAFEPAVTVDVANRDKQLLAVGAPVTIEFGDGTTVDGTVVEQVSVPQDDGTTMARATIEPDGEVPGEPGQVTISVDSTLASDVMIVPVGALLALAEGGYAVERVGDTGGTELVGVELGEILEGKAEITGGIDPGDLVLVAK